MTLKEFYKYVFDFYGDGGIYDIGVTTSEIKHATNIHIGKIAVGMFEGDFLDREAVRDIMMDIKGIRNLPTTGLKLVLPIV